jgi:thymidine kinase
MAKLHFYYSAMNAGKSTTLLQSSYNYREKGMESLILVPSIGSRHEEGKISSRIGLESQAINFSPQADLSKLVQEYINLSPNIRCVFIDEAHFLTKAQVWQLTQIVDQLHIPVLAYGLRSDFLGEPFEASQYLLAWAEDLIEIKTICRCGRKAIMNLRINEKGQAVRSGAQFEVGGDERYVAVCRQHFKEGRIQ